MNESQFREHVFQRALVLAKTIYSITNGHVYQGPFKGLHILPDYLWGDGDISGKLLGLYETQLSNIIEEIIATNPDCVLNVGCAEGYYGLGFAKRLKCVSHLIDVEVRYEDIIRKTAELNQIENYSFTTESNISNFKKLISDKINPFIFMDCESNELHLLNPEVFPELNKTTILVETHDFIIPNCTTELIKRFSDTHFVKEIHSAPKNMNLDILHNLSDLDKMVLWNEWRPGEMCWLYMIPKKKYITMQTDGTIMNKELWMNPLNLNK